MNESLKFVDNLKDRMGKLGRPRAAGLAEAAYERYRYQGQNRGRKDNYDQGNPRQNRHLRAPTH